jgi:excisionase family DNA binding protein
MSADEWLTVNEICDEFKVCRRTVYGWMTAKKVPYIVLAGGNRRIKRRDVFHDGIRGTALADAAGDRHQSRDGSAHGDSAGKDSPATGATPSRSTGSPVQSLHASAR